MITTKKLSESFDELESLLSSIPSKVSEDELATAAFTGKYTDLIETPTKVSEFENDSQFINQIQLNTQLANKVDKDGNKVLSSNDFTDEDKAKLDSIENVIDGVILNGTQAPVENNKVIINTPWKEGDGDKSVVTSESGNLATGDYSVAEGLTNRAQGIASHAEGNQNITVGNYSHVEGQTTKANGDCSHAEGSETIATGNCAHAEGLSTFTQNEAEHAEGRYNVSHKASNVFGDAGNTQHSIGIGKSMTAEGPRYKNAVEIMQNGDAYFLGVGGYDGTNPTNSNSLREVLSSTIDAYTKSETDALLADKQDTISDLTTIRTNAQAGKTASDNLGGHTVAKDVPSNAVFTDTIYDDTQVRGLISTEVTRATNKENAIESDVDAIENVIPSQASSSNQLADKDFVNSSISTNTSNYISDDGQPFTSVSDLPTSGVTNNDYAFVTGTDTEGNTYYDRYKATVRGSTVSWAKEYRLNNSSFTAVQWAAITSGITAALVGKLNDLPTNSQLTTLLTGKADISDIPTQLSQLSEDSTHRTVTDTEKSTWNNKSDFSGDYNDLENKPTIPSIQGLATETYVNNAVSPKANSADVYNKTYIDGLVNTIEAELNQKQATLVSGTNIKTVNSQSVLGEGNLIVGTVTSEVYKQTEYSDYFPIIPDGVVDLGLSSGLLWAKCNLGANTETDYGDYYMWGSITPDTNNTCDWNHAPFNNGSSSYDSIYFKSVKDTVCPNGILAPEYDVITVNMGTGWRMPTMADFEELLSDTNNEWVENYNGTDINGYKFTNKSDSSKYIFIPASGFRDGSSVRYVDSRGLVWSSSLGSNSLSYAQYLDFDGSDIYVDETHRRHGRSVRGIYNPNN